MNDQVQNFETAKEFFLLGLNALEKEAYVDAETLFLKSLELIPDRVSTLVNLSAAQIKLKKYKQSKENSSKVLLFDDTNIDAMKNLIVSNYHLENYKEVLKFVDGILKIEPDYSEAYLIKGNVLREQGFLLDASESYKKAIEINAEYKEAYLDLGNVYDELGMQNEALACFEKLIRLAPKSAEAYMNHANMLNELGDSERAIASYEKAIQLKPDFSEAYFNQSLLLTKLGRYQPEIEILENLYGDSESGSGDRKFLSYTLFNAHDYLGNYEKAFSFLKEANYIRKQEINYDFKKDQIIFEEIKRLFSYEIDRFSNYPNENDSISPNENDSISPILIVGLPRSGTSLVEQILASHSAVYGAGELSALKEIMLKNLKKEDKVSISQIKNQYKRELGKLNVNEKIITDKMPLNFRWIGFFLKAFPNGKVIHVTRDPVATCWSIYKHYFSLKGNGYAYDLHDISNYYKIYIDLMNFWKTTFLDKIYELDYEKLTIDPNDEILKLLNYCELPFEESCLKSHLTKRAVRTASVNQVRKEIYQGSSNNWKNYKSQLDSLRVALNC